MRGLLTIIDAKLLRFPRNVGRNKPDVAIRDGDTHSFVFQKSAER